MSRNYDGTTPDPRSVLHDLYSSVPTYAPPVTTTSTPIVPNVTRPDFSATIMPIVNTSNLLAMLDKSLDRLSDTFVPPVTSPRPSVIFNRSFSVSDFVVRPSNVSDFRPVRPSNAGVSVHQPSAPVANQSGKPNEF